VVIVAPVPVPVPVPVIIPQPIPVAVPVFVPQPVYVAVPVPVPVPVPGPGPGPWQGPGPYQGPVPFQGVGPDAPPVAFPVIMPESTAPLTPALQNVVLPAISQVVEPPLLADLQETPLQLVPVEEDMYVLAHPLFFCDLGTANTCEHLADELASITDGFGTMETEGPNGYGIYLTYEGLYPAMNLVIEGAPLQEVALDDGTVTEVRVLLFCDLDAAATCDGLAAELATINDGFGTMLMDGPQGYGVYLIHEPNT
jgi:hypothetical protein